MTVATTLLEGNLPLHTASLRGLHFIFTAFDNRDAPSAAQKLTKWASDPSNLEEITETIMGDGSAEFPADFTLSYTLLAKVVEKLGLADLVDASPVEVYAIGADTKYATHIISVGVTSASVEEDAGSQEDDWN